MRKLDSECNGLVFNSSVIDQGTGYPVMEAVLWKHHEITDLGTLGGNGSAPYAVNGPGQVVGAALNTTPDSFSTGFPAAYCGSNLCISDGYFYGPCSSRLPPKVPKSLRAFVWDPKNGIQDLGTLGGTDAEAFGINEHGQVIGDSYTSSNPGFCYGVTSGAFIWDRKHGMVDLGSFGGTCTVPIDMNNHSQVVGVGWVAGDAYNRAFLWENGSLRDLGGFEGNNTAAYAINEKGEAVGFAQHAALWKHVGELTDLGTVGSDPCSFAQGINDRGQVVGNSSPSDCVNYDPSRGFLWENGSITDLNTLIPSNSPLYVVYAYTINNSGEIAVNGIDGNGN